MEGGKAGAVGCDSSPVAGVRQSQVQEAAELNSVMGVGGGRNSCHMKEMLIPTKENQGPKRFHREER